MIQIEDIPALFSKSVVIISERDKMNCESRKGVRSSKRKKSKSSPGPLWSLIGRGIHAGRVLVDKAGGRRGYVVAPRDHNHNSLKTDIYLVKWRGQSEAEELSGDETRAFMRDRFVRRSFVPSVILSVQKAGWFKPSASHVKWAERISKSTSVAGPVSMSKPKAVSAKAAPSRGPVSQATAADLPSWMLNAPARAEKERTGREIKKNDEIVEEDSVLSWTGRRYPKSVCLRPGDVRIADMTPEDSNGEFVIERIVDEYGTGKNRMYLVKWKGYELNPGDGDNVKGDWEGAKGLAGTEALVQWRKSHLSS